MEEARFDSRAEHWLPRLRSFMAFLSTGGKFRDTIYIRSPPFELGNDWWSHLRKAPRRRRISHTHPVWLWGHSLFKISSPGPVLQEIKWLLWRPDIRSPTLHSRCGINKGLIKRGSTIDHWKSRCKGWILWPTPYTYIHTYLHTWKQCNSWVQRFSSDVNSRLQ
jgi:hypothetical protein